MREFVGPALVLVLASGLLFVAWYLPRRKRVAEARRLLTDRKQAAQVNAQEIAQALPGYTVATPLNRTSRRGR